MLLQAILFRKLIESNLKHEEKLATEMQDLEVILNHAKVRKKKKKAIDEDLQKRLDDDIMSQESLIRRLNTCKKQQASRDGRHQIWRQFKDVLIGALDAFQSQTNPGRGPVVVKAHEELNEFIALNSRLLKSLDGRDTNYRARIEARAWWVM